MNEKKLIGNRKIHGPWEARSCVFSNLMDGVEFCLKMPSIIYTLNLRGIGTWLHISSCGACPSFSSYYTNLLSKIMLGEGPCSCAHRTPAKLLHSSSLSQSRRSPGPRLHHRHFPDIRSVSLQGWRSSEGILRNRP